MNMTVWSVDIEMLSYWHIGSGKGQGADVDAVVLKDENDLPYIPGRTIKGLFREAFSTLRDCELCGKDVLLSLFGDEGKTRNSTQGRLIFANAVLNDADKCWLLSEDGSPCRAVLYDCFSSTKIDKNGIAEDHSLHTIEATVPLTLCTEISMYSANDEDETERYIKKACSLIRVLGLNRNRGMGRCRFTLTGRRDV